MNKRKEKARVARPNAFLYAVICGLACLYIRFFKRQRLHIRLPKDIKPPFILIGNHSSFFDFLYAIRAFYPRRIIFVVARKYFHFPGMKIALKIGNAIPKSLYEADLSAVSGMFSILRQGGIVGIYPEGQIAMYGVSIDNGESIAKFVKKAGVPVVCVKTGGAFFANPPWGAPQRKGYVETFVEMVLTSEQIQAAPVHDIADAVRQSIYMNNYDWQEKSGATFTGKNPAEGLENMLYRCPSCQSEFTLTAQGDTITCTQCGMKAFYTTEGRLYFGGENYFQQIHEWHQWELSYERTLVESAFQNSEPVTLAMLNASGNGIEIVGNGVFTASNDGYSYEGCLQGEQTDLFFPAAGIRYFPFDPGKNFQIYHQNQLYEFRPQNTKWCAKIANICECLHHSAVENIHHGHQNDLAAQ